MSKPQSQRPRTPQQGKKIRNISDEEVQNGTSIYRTLLSSRWRFTSTPSNTAKDHHPPSPVPPLKGPVSTLPKGVVSSSKGQLKGRDANPALRQRTSAPRLASTASVIPKRTLTAATREGTEHTPKPKAAATSNHLASHGDKTASNTKTVSRSKSTGDLISRHQKPVHVAPKEVPAGPRPSKKGLTGVGKPTRVSVPARLGRAKPSPPKPSSVCSKLDAAAPKTNAVASKPDTAAPKLAAVTPPPGIATPSSAAAPVSPAAVPMVKETPPQPDSMSVSDEANAATPEPTPPQPSSPTQQRNTTPKRGVGGASVKFGATTVHRVEIGPGHHLFPIRRGHKSKSGLTYLNPPADTSHRKVTVEFPPGKEGKLRRHRERQAAMERYWLRTEEEEAEWRAEATRIAEEETVKYRSEPASSPSDREVESDEGGVGKGEGKEGEQKVEGRKEGRRKRDEENWGKQKKKKQEQKEEQQEKGKEEGKEQGEVVQVETVQEDLDHRKARDTKTARAVNPPKRMNKRDSA